MRRTVFLVLGVFELAIAAVLLAIGVLLPGPLGVRASFARAERLTGNGQKQLTMLSSELAELRSPRVRQLALKVEPRLKRTLGSLAEGMDTWARALDPQLVQQLSDGVAQLASFLDQSVAPVAGRSAARLEKTSAALQEDALVLGQLLKAAPPDLKAAREVYESLGRFNEGLERVSVLMDADRLKAMRDGFKGMEGSLATGADQVARLASYNYPVVKFNGLKPKVDEKPFWPQGDRVADGMRKGAKALQAAGKELDVQAANLPKLQQSLEESRRSVLRTRAALGKALKDQDKLEAVLRRVPQTTARLADDLPALTADLAKVLREAERLKEVAAALRSKQQNVEAAAKTWPALRTRLLVSAERLRELEQTLDPALTDPTSLGTRLDRLEQKHQQGLADLGHSLGEVRDVLPEMADTTATIVLLVRCLLWLSASLAAFHGLAQFLKLRHRPRPAAAA